MRKFLLLFIFSWCLSPIFAYKIDIQVDVSLQEKTVIHYTLEDVKTLLEKSGATEVNFNSLSDAEVKIILPELLFEKSIG